MQSARWEKWIPVWLALGIPAVIWFNTSNDAAIQSQL
jgi:hypothetical protein